MRPIPAKLKKELEADPFYKNCCITGMPATADKIDWHHNFTFANRQVNEKWCILPICEGLHKRVKSNRDLRERLNWVMLNRATDEQLKKYSKAINLIAERERLNKIYG